MVAIENFYYSIPTKAHFGKGVVSKAGKLALEFGKKAMLFYGDGIVRKICVYKAVTDSLKASGLEYVELSGIMPNLHITKVDEGVQLCRDEDIAYSPRSG